MSRLDSRSKLNFKVDLLHNLIGENKNLRKPREVFSLFIEVLCSLGFYALVWFKALVRRQSSWLSGWAWDTVWLMDPWPAHLCPICFCPTYLCPVQHLWLRLFLTTVLKRSHFLRFRDAWIKPGGMLISGQSDMPVSGLRCQWDKFFLSDRQSRRARQITNLIGFCGQVSSGLP